MNNLVRFFIRYHLLLLFVALQALAFYFIFKESHFHNAIFFNTANALNGTVYKSYNSVKDYLYLKRANDSLVAENAALRAMLIESKYQHTTESWKKEDTVSKQFIQRYVYFPAKVIRNSIDHANNIIYLDKGRLQGVHEQMGVIAPSGIVGQVIDVTDNYCAVMSVLNKDFKLSAKIKKNNYFGNLRWSGLDAERASMEEIPKHVAVQQGDTIVTSGYSSLYPENVMIGTVEKVKAEVDKPFMRIDVKLSTRFRNLDFVYIVKDLQRMEIIKLDSITQKKRK